MSNQAVVEVKTIGGAVAAIPVATSFDESLAVTAAREVEFAAMDPAAQALETRAIETMLSSGRTGLGRKTHRLASGDPLARNLL